MLKLIILNLGSKTHFYTDTPFSFGSEKKTKSTDMTFMSCLSNVLQNKLIFLQAHRDDMKVTFKKKLFNSHTCYIDKI